MIALKRLNGKPFILNADHIESLESTPDTMVKLLSGKTVVTLNSIEDIVRKTLKYKQMCHQAPRVVKSEDTGETEKK